MWERAEDWCHYRDISGKMEALYFLQKLNVYYNSTMLYNADLSKLDERSWNPYYPFTQQKEILLKYA